MSANVPSSTVSEPAVPAGIVGNAVHFKTEDDTPVDNVYSEKQQRLFTEPLYSSWPGPGGNHKFVAMANVGLFYAQSKPPVVPDGLLSANVEVPDDMWKREHRSYFVWKYRKPPEVVIEVVSNAEGGELGDKLRIYAEVPVKYYVVWDPEDHWRQGRLLGFCLQESHYEPYRDLWFPEVELGLKTWQGAFEGKEAEWLRWCNQHGELIPTGAEGQRAERLRAERLAEQLRALGVKPNE